jgi:hypothetical protein
MRNTDDRRPIRPPDIYDEKWPPRMPPSVRRYGYMQKAGSRAVVRVTYHNTPIPRRASALHNTTEDYPAQTPEPDTTHHQAQGRSSPRLHWLVYAGGAMLIAMLGWIALTAFVQWWQVKQDDIQYGRPRTAQYDAVVGHNDSAANPSHFIALNLRGHIRIIEFPGDDATKAKVYIGPDLLGPGQDLAPATLSFKDVNGDGKTDMIVTVQGSRFIFINNGSTFVPPKH